MTTDYRKVLDARREALGISKAALARTLGLSQPLVSQVLGERNGHHFSLTTYLQVCEYLGMDPTPRPIAGANGEHAAAWGRKIGPHLYGQLWREFAERNREAIDNADPDAFRDYVRESGGKLPHLRPLALRQNALEGWVKRAFFIAIRRFRGRHLSALTCPAHFPPGFCWSLGIKHTPF